MKEKNILPLVSIITPCYNGENFVHKFLESVLNQTYPNIELIFINDGSTDKTEEIVLSYEKKFIERGIKLKYFYQEHKGQAAALNKGLKIFKGDYLTWPDSDDILHKDNIKEKVMFLENNKEYDMVLTQSILFDYKNDKVLKKRVLKRVLKKGEEDNLFEDLILEKNIYFAPGGYMIRTSAFKEINKDLQIYESQGGQNWQMLLPISYSKKCGYINKELYFIYDRRNSHSRSVKTLDDQIKRAGEHEDILLNTISNASNISEEDKKYYIKLVKEKYMKKRMNLYFEHKRFQEFLNIYKTLKDENKLTKTDKYKFWASKNIIFFYSFKFLRKFKNLSTRPFSKS
jgi:glycosyltransferase involved in cell wall biosynthesis